MPTNHSSCPDLIVDPEILGDIISHCGIVAGPQIAYGLSQQSGKGVSSRSLYPKIVAAFRALQAKYPRKFYTRRCQVRLFEQPWSAILYDSQRPERHPEAETVDRLINHMWDKRPGMCEFDIYVTDCRATTFRNLATDDTGYPLAAWLLLNWEYLGRRNDDESVAQSYSVSFNPWGAYQDEHEQIISWPTATFRNQNGTHVRVHVPVPRHMLPSGPHFRGYKISDFAPQTACEQDWRYQVICPRPPGTSWPELPQPTSTPWEEIFYDLDP